LKVRDRAVEEIERKQRRRFKIPAIGLLDSMKVTIRTMLSRAVTIHYPEERMELPARARGVIALLEENCTVCMLCAKECPCWCIYIEGHKEREPGKRKAVNVLDRFAIDYGLCMYCGICVEVCPFDALHWSPAFEYTSYTYEGLVHELDVLKAWEYAVLPPPALVDDADEALRKQADQDATKRRDGVAGVIREAPKRDAYVAQYGVQHAPTPARAIMAPPDVPEPVTAVAAAPPRPTAAAPAPAAAAAPTAPAPAATAPPPPAAEQAAAAAPAAGPAAATAHAPAGADLGDVPRIDPNNLPAGIGPVERGRLKKLAHFQEHGRTPPADLIANLKPILDQLRSG
jgi:formate hydrogenlyase subunit 6/NADH:ubiquinone oxidoreductase subunit I